MSDRVLQFERKVSPFESKPKRVAGLAATLERRPDAIVFTVHGVQLELTNEQAIALAAELITCARQPSNNPTEPQA